MPPFVLNIPNCISIARLVLIPLASIPLLPVFGEHNINILSLVFIAYVIAALTDFLDGYFARLLNQKTEWGAYIDPLIDKFLIWAVYCVFIFIPQLNIPLWTFIIIIIRDLSVTKMRNYALKYDIIFQTSYLAKVKTATQMLVGGAILLFMLITYYLNQQLAVPYVQYFEYWNSTKLLMNFPFYLVSLVALFTGITGIDYAYVLYKSLKNKNNNIK